MNPLLPTRRLAAELGISPGTVRRKLASGAWPGLWTGGMWVGDPAEIRAAMAAEAEKRRGKPANVVELRPEPALCYAHPECMNRTFGTYRPCRKAAR